MVTVKSVKVNSCAHKAGIHKGDKIISINGTPFNDSLDLIFAESEERLIINIDGNDKPIIITKQAYEPLGLIFKESLEIVPKHCANKCIFCFIDQLPEGMRDSLYVKDDDYRLSFITGTYITLTNLTEMDIDRIIKYKLSPLYLSVHSYDNEIRRRLVSNSQAIKMFDIIKRLADSGIIMHTQIVLCPEINDGEVLENTLKELLGLYPSVATVSVVPVGLTKHRNRLYPINSVDRNVAREAIAITERINSLANAERGFCWCSDEMYLRAEKELPEYNYYGDFMQIENGVGMVRSFLNGITFERKGKGGEFHLVTGESFYPILYKVASTLEKSSGVKLTVHKIINNYFGESVTVAGLITAVDIIEQLKGKVNEKQLIIPDEMLKEFSEIFLDGITVKELEEALQAKVHICSDNLEDIICGE